VFYFCFYQLGSREHKDIECVVNYLRQDKRISRLALWGRSMGAVASILYARSDPRCKETEIVDFFKILFISGSFSSGQCVCESPQTSRRVGGEGRVF
jgi:hypothetical protein